MKKRRKAYTSRYRNPKIFAAGKSTREKKKKTGFLKRFLQIFVIVAITTGINFFFSNEYLRIKNIEYTGDLTFQEQVKTIVEENIAKTRLLIYRNDNFILFRDKELEEIIKENIPEIKSIEVKRKVPDRLEIRLTERQAALGWETEEKKYFVDEDGYILKETEDFGSILGVKDTSNIAIEENKRVVYPNFIQFVREMTEKVKSYNIEASSVEIAETTFMVDVYAKEGFKVIFNTTKSLNDQLSKLSEALNFVGEDRSRLDYIDLTVKNKAIYKFK